MRAFETFAFVVLTAIIVSGCAHIPKYTSTVDSKYPAKAENCEIKVQATVPSSAQYEEIGTLNGCSGTDNIIEYKEKVTPAVCKAGGDLVVGEVNGYGVYCRGTVFRKKG